MQPSVRPGPRRLLTHDIRLRERFAIHALVRAGLAITIIVGAVLGRLVLGIQDLNVTALVLIGLGMLLYDLLAYRSLRPSLALDAPPEDPRKVVRTLYLLIVLDYLMLVLAIWFVGGTRSPFLPFFLLHVILSCLLLSRRSAMAFHAMAYALLMFLVLGEWLRFLPDPRLPIGAVGGTGPLDGRYAVTVLVVYAILFAVTAYMLLGLSAAVRERERELQRANEALSRLSSIRKDFLRIALHNLQSPIGVVTMFLSNIRAGLGGKVTDQQAHWIDRSLDRLKGVRGFMHDLQMLSSLESGQLDARSVAVDVGDMVRNLVEENRDLAEQNRHDLMLEVDPGLPRVKAVELLLREALANYITNAVKYTPPGGHIVVRVLNRPPAVRVEVEDDGIGISPEDQARLFGEFVRLKPKHQEVAKAKGSGLGLTIVKRVAEAHNGRYGVVSRDGEGSTFFFELDA